MYFIRRLILAIPLLLIISFLGFGLMKMAPGSPFDRERKPASPEIERNLARNTIWTSPSRNGPYRYLGIGYEHDAEGKIHWFEGGLIRGDFGPSQQYRNHSVNDIIAQGLPVSLPLGLMAFGFAMGVRGYRRGFHRGDEKGKWEDHLGSFLAILAVCVPGLVMGPVLVVTFAIHYHWFPVACRESPMHAVLPMIALGLQ